MSLFDIRKNPKKIAICGTGQGWEHLPVESDHTIYCLNDFIEFKKYQVKPDVLFIMDVLDEKPSITSGGQSLGSVAKKINDIGCTFIAPFKYAEIPKSMAFPIEECAKKFGEGAMYFTNTICYMIAYAIMQGAEEIETLGVNQAGSHEYAEEKGGVEFWLGIALGKGIKVTVHGKNSQLLLHKGRYGRGVMYGYIQSFKEHMSFIKRFGEPYIHKLSEPQSDIIRTLRKINEFKDSI